jgi:hypothetical protein
VDPVPRRGAGEGRGKLLAFLLYALEQGPTEQRIIQMCVRERMPLPDAIRNAPELYAGLEWVYLAFTELTTERPSGLGTGYIPWSRIVEYADREGITDPEQREDFQDLIRALDRGYVRWRAAKAEKDKPPISNPGGAKAT